LTLLLETLLEYQSTFVHISQALPVKCL